MWTAYVSDVKFKFSLRYGLWLHVYVGKCVGGEYIVSQTQHKFQFSKQNGQFQVKTKGGACMCMAS